jgi:hypothetical protein
MSGTRAGQAARQNLAAFGDELADQANVLVIDHIDLFRAKLADFAAAKVLLPAAATTTAAFPPLGSIAGGRAFSTRNWHGH